MGALPPEIVRVLRDALRMSSASGYGTGSRCWWLGAILTPGQRTVAAVLRVMGLSEERQFQNYHRVLNRARWSSRELSRRLLSGAGRGVRAERWAGRWSGWMRRSSVGGGRRSRRRGSIATRCGRARATSSRRAGCAGFRCRCLAEIPWAGRIWGLPFLTVLAPSERYNLERGRRHKTLPDWGRQMIRQLRRWLPDRALVVVADSTYAVLELLADAARLQQPVTVVTRLRLDAALYDPAPPREPGTKGRPRVKGERQPTLAQPTARSGHDLGDAHRPLVRWRDRAGGGRDRHRPLVPPRRPDRRPPLGAAARSSRAVRAASAAQYRSDRRRQPRSSPGSSPAGHWK